MKPAKTHDEQLDILEARGLIVKDRRYAKKVLSNIGYYRLSGYSLGLRQYDHFASGTTIEKIQAIYQFDEILRGILLGVLEPIEIELRSQISYLLAIKYGNIAHLNPDIFFSIAHHQEFLKQYSKAKEHFRNSKVVFVIHCLEVYGELPVWVAVETFSFGMLSKIFGNMKSEDQKIVAGHFGISINHLSGWLECFCQIRNICAHSGRIYNRIIAKQPKLYREDKRYTSQKLFPILIAIKKVHAERHDRWLAFHQQLVKAISENHEINLRFMGFPDEWETILQKR
jgi:abortive infection bacteriophage resistance protein